MSRFESLTTGVLVIGAGAAGIRAVLAAAESGVEATLVSKGAPTGSGSTFSPLSAGWGMQALAGDERADENLESFYEDILGAGLGLCDPKLVRILVEESGPRLEELVAYGLRLKQDPEGRPLRVKGCFSEVERAYLTENMVNIRETFFAMLRASRARVLSGTAAELIVRDGACCGAWIVTADGKILRVGATAVVLATGGGAGLFEHHLASASETGDGYALAHRAGAELKNLEFIQFMLGIKGEGTRRFLPLPDLGRPGALLDPDGRDILTETIPSEEARRQAFQERMKHHPFSTRDGSCLIDIALAQAHRSRGRVWWNSGEPGAERLEAVHMAHAFNGGVVINEEAETTLPGLFAAGEAAAGPHGADRIGGCMMTATQVFGERAGRFAARRAKKTLSLPPVETPGVEIPGSEKQDDPEVRQAVRRLFPEIAGALTVLRDAEGLHSSLERIGEARNLLGAQEGAVSPAFLKERHSLTVFELITTHALRRKESCGSHFRLDHPPAPEIALRTLP